MSGTGFCGKRFGSEQETDRVPRLSAIVITKNEEANIGACLDGLAFCDERIVVDAGSTDRTAAIAAEKGARVAPHEWRGVGGQENFALSLAEGGGVRTIDADGRVAAGLAQEVERANAEGTYYRYMKAWLAGRRHG